MKRIALNCCFLLITGIALYSCNYNEAKPVLTGTNAGNPCGADTVITASYSTDIQPIFNAHCATAGCHLGSNSPAGLNLEASSSYNCLMTSGSGYINTEHPTSSIVYSQITSVNTPMPPTASGGLLDICTVNKVLKWIQQGAKNN